MIAALLLASFAAAPTLVMAEVPPVEVWASEDWPADTLQAAARLPAATLGLTLRSNMVRPEALAVLQRRKGGALVRLVPPLVPAHVDQFRKLTRVTLVVPLAGPLDAKLAAQLGRLGPQPLRLLAARMDAATALSLSGLKHAEVELDVRGRVPDQEELGVLLGLSRLRRVVRLRAADPPALVPALRAAKPVRLVVESDRGRIPEPMLAALMETGVPVRVVFDLETRPEDLKRLAALPNLTLELALPTEPERALPMARAVLEGLTVAQENASSP